MSKHYEDLKADIKSWYPGQSFTDKELNEMTDKLIEFFALGVEFLCQHELSMSKVENDSKEAKTPLKP